MHSWLLLLVGSLLAARAGADPAAPPGELAREILQDPTYQRGLDQVHDPEIPRDPGQHSSSIHVGGSAAAGAQGMGGVVGLLAWLAVGVALALAGVWVAAAVVRRRREVAAATPEARAHQAAAGHDPSLEAVRALAAQGRFTQAIHELLLLSVQRLARRHGRSISGWLTSRELIRLLPATEDERRRFSRLVAWVERALFGGQPVDRQVYDACLSDFMDLGLG